MNYKILCNAFVEGGLKNVDVKVKIISLQCSWLKDTLMQIWKFHYMLEFIEKEYPENFTLLILGILEFLPVKFVFFLKSWLIFKTFYCFCMFVNKHFINTGAYISKCEQYYNVKPSAYYFYLRTNIPLYFCICISVPLKHYLLVTIIIWRSFHFFF